MSNPNFSELSKGYCETEKVTLEGKKLAKLRRQASGKP